MVLVDVSLPPLSAVPSEGISALIANGESQVQRFYDRSASSEQQRVGRSDFRRVAEVLADLKSLADHPLPSFCEWGSGFGINTCVAAMLGYRAVGIELDTTLVEYARGLAQAFHLEATFVTGNFIPPTGHALLDPLDDLWLTSLDGPSAYATSGHAIADFDVIFAYPAPGEGRFIADLFDHFAGRSAMLISFHGAGELRVRRKVVE